jgi:squalene-hopene/tetraprenyl-beta-curcumene cyclase
MQTASNLNLIATTLAVLFATAAGPAWAEQADDAGRTGAAQADNAARPAAGGAGPGADARAVIDAALAYLKSRQQPDGSWQRSPREPVAITALVVRAFAADEKFGPGADFVKKGYARLLAEQQPDGGIYKDMLANYNTAIAVSALSSSKDPAHKAAMDKAVAYLKGAQFSDTVAGPDGEKIDVNHPYYGGWGYGGRGQMGRPDLSNTNVVLEALKDAGLKPDDPAYQRALKFATRMQNLSETNPAPWAGDDGGFVYGINNKGEANSAAGEYDGPAGRRMVRSYGSMTYGGLKSMIYAGLSKDDPRVKAAFDWIRKNWTLDENPGMRLGDPKAAEAGLYYYYQTFGKALAAWGEPTVTDAVGKGHDWRVELIRELKERQRPDGSFVGTNKWMEDNPVLSTTFSVLAMQEALQDLRRNPAK